MLQEFVESPCGDIDLSKPSKAGLIYLLRNRELWPASFGPWNFADLSCCAMGLSAAVWAKKGKPYYWPYELAGVLGISKDDAIRIFGYGEIRLNEVATGFARLDKTPDDVADLLEAV